MTKGSQCGVCGKVKSAGVTQEVAPEHEGQRPYERFVCSGCNKKNAKNKN